MRYLFILVLIFGFISCSHIRKTAVMVQGDPLSSDELNIAVGRKVYELHCARCHGALGEGDGPDAKALSAALPNFTDGSYDKSIELVAANIMYGKREEMPAFGAQLSELELWNVAHFIQALRR